MVAIAALAVATTGVVPAGAHVPADVQIASPAEGAEIATSVDVVLTAAANTPGAGVASFTLALDGAPVDATGAVGGRATFTSLTLTAGQRLSIPLRNIAAGRHELRVVYAEDVDSDKPDVVRIFEAGESKQPRSRTGELVGGGAFVLLLGLSVLLRRRAVRQIS